MQYVRLGQAGIKVSRLCLGCMTYGAKAWREWVLEEEESRPFLFRALELGINFFDTADMYSLGRSEEILGRALADSGIARHRLVVATKLYNPIGDDPNERGLSRKHILHSIENSLRRLRTDYIDLYQIHRFDPETPIEETLEALTLAVRQGKVLYLGASSMFAWQLMKMLAVSDAHGWSRFIAMQNHYNLAYREEEREMIPLCRAEGLAVIPWSPLARGFLAGQRRPADYGDTSRAKSDHLAQRYYYQPADFAVLDAVERVAAARGASNAEVALAWVLSRPAVTAPIIGASKPHHLDQAITALSMELSAQEIAALEAPYVPHRVLGHA